MKRRRVVMSTAGWALALGIAAAAAGGAPEHYKNDPANINPDPDYVPGDYPLPEVHSAEALYHAKKAELASAESAGDADRLFTLGIGEISFVSVKNENASVLGYFRDYIGAARMRDGLPERMDLLVNVNSLDTAVPGRNNRILDLLFRSATPDLGTCSLEFRHFDPSGATGEVLSDGQPHPVAAAGTIVLNGVTRPLQAALQVRREGSVWIVETVEPVEIRLSDFAFGDAIYALMASCNHVSIADAVRVNAILYMR